MPRVSSMTPTRAHGGAAGEEAEHPRLEIAERVGRPRVTEVERGDRGAEPNTNRHTAEPRDRLLVHVPAAGLGDRAQAERQHPRQRRERRHHDEGKDESFKAIFTGPRQSLRAEDRRLPIRCHVGWAHSSASLQNKAGR